MFARIPGDKIRIAHRARGGSWQREARRLDKVAETLESSSWTGGQDILRLRHRDFRFGILAKGSILRVSIFRCECRRLDA